MLIAILTLALCSAFSAPQDPTPKADNQLIEITYLANAGFLIRSGNSGILIDAFVPREVEGLEALEGKVRKHMMRAKPPFDRPMIGLVSHAHPDHFKAPFLQNVLLGNPNLMLISSEQVIRALSRGANNWDKVADRALSFKRNPRRKALPFVDSEKELAVSFLDLPHATGGDADLSNIAHLVRMGGFKFLHLGDAAVSLAALKSLKLVERKIDVAMVPYWFYASREGAQAIDEGIHPRHVIVYHIPPAEKAKFSEKLKAENPDVIIFGKPMERKIFEVPKQR